MIWPSQIQWVSIPSIAFCTISLWNTAIYLTCFPLFPLEAGARKKCLLFGLISLSFASFSFGTICLYSVGGYEAARFWQGWQFASAIFTLTFLILFSNSYLSWLKPRMQVLFCVATLAFLPWVYHDNFFLNHTPLPKTFSLFGHDVRIYEVGFGVGAYFFAVWALFNLIVITFRAVKFYRKTHTSVSLAAAFFIFILTLTNDTLVASDVYHFFYLLEPSCMIYIVAMSVQIFYDYVDTSAQVIRKTQEVKSLNEEMRFLVSTISHDFAAPLLSIQGFTEMIEGMDLQEQERFRHYLSRIKHNANHLRSLVGDLSDYIKAGQVQDKLREIEVVDLFREVLESLHLPARYPQARVIVPSDETRIVSSKKRLRQILFNLTENALKYSDPQDQRIELKIERVDNGVLINLEDRGPGIPLELHEKVFEPFFRNSRDLPGSGLGLAITKKCVEKLDGAVWIEGAAPTGTRFCIWLPDPRSAKSLHGTKRPAFLRPS